MILDVCVIMTRLNIVSDNHQSWVLTQLKKGLMVVGVITWGPTGNGPNTGGGDHPMNAQCGFWKITIKGKTIKEPSEIW